MYDIHFFFVLGKVNYKCAYENFFVQLLGNTNPAGLMKQRVFMMERVVQASISQKFKVWHMPKLVEEIFLGIKEKKKIEVAAYVQLN